MFGLRYLEASLTGYIQSQRDLAAWSWVREAACVAKVTARGADGTPGLTPSAGEVC
jgi:hypothetical protein